MKTDLQPYNPFLYSPTRTINVGDLAITLDDPRGFCVIVTNITSEIISFHYLDDKDKIEHKTDTNHLIPTGKTPLSFLELYEPTPVSLDRALDLERSFPDFTQVKPKTKGGGSRQKAKKELTDGQKDLLKELILRKLKGEQI